MFSYENWLTWREVAGPICSIGWKISHDIGFLENPVYFEDHFR
jgi:hypothetical protein